MEYFIVIWFTSLAPRIAFWLKVSNCSQAPLYWEIYAPKGLKSARICFTCHNFEYQGAASASDLASCGLDVNHLNRPDRMQHHSDPNRVNPVKVMEFTKLVFLLSFLMDSIGYAVIFVLSPLMLLLISGSSRVLQHCDYSVTNICPRGADCWGMDINMKRQIFFILVKSQPILSDSCLRMHNF